MSWLSLKVYYKIVLLQSAVMGREDWDALVERVATMTLAMKPNDTEQRWMQLDPRNTLGWRGFLENSDAQVCLSWLIYECVYWGGIVLHVVNEMLNNKSNISTRVAVAGAKTIINANISNVKTALKQFGLGAMNLVFFNIPFQLPFDETHCVAFMNANIDLLSSLEQYESHLSTLKEKAERIYALYRPGEHISERIPPEFMHLVPQLSELYSKFIDNAASAAAEIHQEAVTVPQKNDGPLQMIGKAVKLMPRSTETKTVVEEHTNKDGTTTKTTTTTVSGPNGITTKTTTETVKKK